MSFLNPSSISKIHVLIATHDEGKLGDQSWSLAIHRDAKFPQIYSVL